MNAQSQMLVLPRIDPGRERQAMAVPAGTSVAEMVALAFPGLVPGQLGHIRVVIGDVVITRDRWHLVRPKPGITAVIRVIPGDDSLRSVLSIAVLVAAVALGQFYAMSVAGSVAGSIFGSGIVGYGGAVAASSGLVSATGALLTSGFAIAGSLLIDAFIPARGLGDQEKGADVYAITGLQNSANPGGVIPSILGAHRYAPPYAAPPHGSIIGIDQYVTAAFLFGYGPLQLSNHRLGDTPISEFNDLQIEIHEGYESDGEFLLYPQQVVEEALAVTLKAAEPPRVRVTARHAASCEVDIAFVQGLVRYDDKGRAQGTHVYVKIAYRAFGSSDPFVDVITLDCSNAQPTLHRRTYRWDFPVQGQYEVQLQRLTEDATDIKVQDRSDWSAIRTYRSASPFNFGKPLCMVTLRVRASNQLNGTLNNYNADASLLCRDWDAASQTWVVRLTSNPASLFRHVLQGPANAYPKTDDEIDLAGLQDWHEFCEARGLAYNRVHDAPASRLDVLADIAAAGRATPHDDGSKWGVVVDRPQTVHVSAISPRNSWDFQGSTPQVVFPDGHKVQFIDETNGYQQAERIIPFPGVAPDDVRVTEDLAHPGITNPDLIWKETRRRQYELIHRPHSYSVSQDFEALINARGDLVALNHDVLDRDQVSARVRSVGDHGVVVLDTPVKMDAGRGYACVFRVPDGSFLRRPVITAPGETSVLTVIGDVSAIPEGDLVLFGTSVKGPTVDVVVKSIERGDNLTSKITFVDAAPIIDELTDAEIPPPWDSRVGEAVDLSEQVPAVPSVSVTDEGLVFNIFALAGTTGAAPTHHIVVSYRPHGGGAFSTQTVNGAAGIAYVAGFIAGDVIDVKARAVSAYGVSSADSGVVQATMHSASTNQPMLDSSNVTIDSTSLTMDHF